MRILVIVAVLVVVGAREEEGREDRGGFREKVQCIENGKFYRETHAHATT